tara:strand:+ start:6690 stop:8480 length:1791 start_codon:yes stop_codon:yes gene_type:complete
MNTIGITFDANSSASAMSNGKLIAAISEERFNKIKNYVGYPKESVEFCLEALGGKVDKVLVPSVEADPILVLSHWTRRDVSERMEEQYKYWYPKIYEGKDLNYAEVFPESIDLDQYPGREFWEQIDLTASKEDRIKKFQELRKQLIAEHLSIPESSIVFVEHHLCHSMYAYYGSPIRNEPTLCFTADGFGDYHCATLRLIDEHGVSKTLLETDQALLGRLYRFTTLNLKMKPLEDEYKVMGLAPYASEYHWQHPYNIFREYMDVEGINFVVKNKPKDFFFDFGKKLNNFRFDAIAGGLQKYTEEMLVKWVTNAIEITGVRNVVFSGGVSMNVKAMLEISKIPTLEKLFVPPSGADESLCVGACYYEASQHMPSADITPVDDGYLGDSYTQEEIDNYLSDNKISDVYDIIEECPPNQVAELLDDGCVVSLFLGRMEFGARALGARSIVADPRSPDTIKRINRKIKNRDFWMPFAPVVLDERFDDYFYNEKNLHSPYMTIGFETKTLAQDHLKAAIHPADLSGRPQRLVRDRNPRYYDIIKSFEQRTGVGGLLNTSFNLHGLPIAMTPKDAFHVFDNSGLDAMLLEGTLVVKKGVLKK